MWMAPMRCVTAGLTDQEFDLLALAKANSDGLTHRELAAMALMDDQGPSAHDGRGGRTKRQNRPR